jgi:aspartate aminotransferase/aminotransferase
MEFLAERTGLIDASGIRKVFALAASLKNPVNFSIGQPDFDVPDEIKKEAIKAIQEGNNRYSQTAGDAELLDKLKGMVSKQYGWDGPGVLVSSGVSGALLLAFFSTINPGDEVIIPDPYFVIYKHVINMIGGKCVFVDSYPDFKVPVEGIKKAVSDKTKMIILNSPCNPTGAVYSADELKEVAKIAEDKNIMVLSDEIYDLFSYDENCASIASYYDKTLLLKGFSKSYAMTGWRMGYVAVNEAMKPVLEQMTKIQQYTFVCAPTPFQKASVKALDCDITEQVASYKQKRDRIYEGLKGKFEVTRPGGAFYIFVKAPSWAKTATEFVEKAVENNVLVIPGQVFSEKDTHFRISYATSLEQIDKGIEILCSLT